MKQIYLLETKAYYQSTDGKTKDLLDTDILPKVFISRKQALEEMKWMRNFAKTMCHEVINDSVINESLQNPQIQDCFESIHPQTGLLTRYTLYATYIKDK